MKIIRILCLAGLVSCCSSYVLSEHSVEIVSLTRLEVIRGGDPCFKPDSFECSGNVPATSCASTACVQKFGLYNCPQRPTGENPDLPPSPPGWLNISYYFEIESRSIAICNDSTNGLTNKTPGPWVACQVVYNCDCNPTLGGACRKNNFVYNSTDDRMETGCWGDLCPL